MPRRKWSIAFGSLLLALVAACAVWVLRDRRPVTVRASGPGISKAATRHDAGRSRQRVGGLDVTFLVASDTHFGFDADEAGDSGAPRDPVREPAEIDRINARAIQDMNQMPGRPWPAALGGAVGTPRGVLVSGDLTENGAPWQWQHFVAYYGLNGGDGVVAYPVFEAHGNHDKHHSWYVLDRIRERHGDTRYAFDWDDLHLVCLGEAPDDEGLAWLELDLASVGKDRPVMLYFHFPLRGPFSRRNWFGDGDYPSRLARTVFGYNVVGLFHGHYHQSGRYEWEGIDVYKPGASKHQRHGFLVVHVSDTRLRVAAWQHDHRHWDWWHDKPINGALGEAHTGGEHEDQGMLLEQ